MPEAVVELAPQDVVLGGVVAEQGAAADTHGRSDVVQRRDIEALSFEECEGFPLDGGVGGDGRPAQGSAVPGPRWPVRRRAAHSRQVSKTSSADPLSFWP
jgi:hypothetical protein